MDGKFDVFVASEEVLQGDLDGDLAAAWRFDKAPAEQGVLSEVASSSAFFGPASRDIAIRLVEADQFLVELPVYPDMRRVFTFDVSDARTGVEQAASVCGVELPALQEPGKAESPKAQPATTEASSLCEQVQQMAEAGVPPAAIVESVHGTSVSDDDLECLVAAGAPDEVLVWAVRARFQ